MPPISSEFQTAMPSTADSTSLSGLLTAQGTTGEKCISSDDLLALRTFFLLLNDWAASGKSDRTCRDVDASTLPHPRQAQISALDSNS